MPVYSDQAKELLQLLKKGKKPVIAPGNNEDGPHGLVVRIFGDDGFAYDFPVQIVFELAGAAPLFNGTNPGPLGDENPHLQDGIETCSNCGKKDCDMTAIYGMNDKCPQWQHPELEKKVQFPGPELKKHEDPGPSDQSNRLPDLMNESLREDPGPSRQSINLKDSKKL